MTEFYMDYMREDFKLRNSGKNTLHRKSAGAAGSVRLRPEVRACCGDLGRMELLLGQKEQSLPERMRAGRMRIRRTVTGRTRRFIFIPTPGPGILPVMKRSRLQTAAASSRTNLLTWNWTA